MQVEIHAYIYSVIFFSCVYVFYSKRATFSSICILAASVYFTSAFCFLVGILLVHCLFFFGGFQQGNSDLSLLVSCLCAIILILKDSSVAGYNSFYVVFSSFIGLF